MKCTISLPSVALAACLLAAGAGAEDELQSDWIELVKGHRDSDLGLEVQETHVDPETGKRHLVIAVPKVALGNQDVMEEVRVIGRRPDRPDLLPDLEYEWVEDYDNDFFGLLVRFNEDQKTPVRLYFSSEAGFLDP
jgi:hypothetical protein